MITNLIFSWQRFYILERKPVNNSDNRNNNNNNTPLLPLLLSIHISRYDLNILYTKLAGQEEPLKSENENWKPFYIRWRKFNSSKVSEVCSKDIQNCLLFNITVMDKVLSFLPPDSISNMSSVNHIFQNYLAPSICLLL